jgi:hypothetical protein
MRGMIVLRIRDSTMGVGNPAANLMLPVGRKCLSMLNETEIRAPARSSVETCSGVYVIS